MTNEEIDRLTKFAVEHIKAGGSVKVQIAPCSRCGSREGYRPNSSPNWMNRWTCPKCGRHESR